MSEENNKKTNIFKEIFKSIKDLDKYEDFATEIPMKAFQYLLKLILIFVAIITLFYTYKIVKNMNDIYANLNNKIPEFSYNKDGLQVDSKEPIIIDDYKDTLGNIIVDTTNSKEIGKYQEELNKKNESGILVLKDKMVLLPNGSNGQVTYNYKDLFEIYEVEEFNKQDIVNFAENLNVGSLYLSIYFIMFIYFFIVYFISILIDVLLLSILAYIVSRMFKIQLKYASSFAISVHSLTLPIILNLIYIIVNLLIGFEIKYFNIMYTTISYIYVIVAILMIKTDLINRQIELIKLAQEQEKVREEMRKREEEEKEKQKEENKETGKNKKQGNKKENKTKKKKTTEDEGVGADAPAYQENR